METTDTTALAEKFYICTAAAHKMNIGAVVLNNAGEIWFWNRWLEEKSGLPAGTAVGKMFLELFPELNNSRLASAINAALKYGLTSLLSQSLNKAPLPLLRTRQTARNACSKRSM